MNKVSDLIRKASGRESIVEDTVVACAKRGGFDQFLPIKKNSSVRVVRGRRGHADVEIIGAAGPALLGLEVKLSSQVNWGYYGGDTARSQLEEMEKHVQQLVIITTAIRANRETWPIGAVVLTLADLANIAADLGLTADDIVSVGFGYAA